MSLSILRRCPVGAFALDDRERFVDANAAFERLTALRADTLAGRRFGEILIPLSETKDAYGELSSRARPEAVVVRILNEGPKAGLRLRLTLWREEATLTALAESLGRYEETAAMLTELAAAVAHEIRNPLAGIGSALEVIADRMPSGGVEREVIAEIRQRLDRLNAQVDDLMLLVRPVKLRKQHCEVDVLVTAACTAAGLPPPGNHSPVTVHADPGLMTKALAGMLRYSAGPTPPKVDWSSSPSHASIRITGGRLASIRGPAAEGWSIRSAQDGLELPVAQRVAEAHEGRLSADLTSMGVTLRFELPLR